MATEKKERIHVKAVRMKKKALKKLNDQKHCCIPETIVKLSDELDENGNSTGRKINSAIKENGNGPKNIKNCPFADIKKARIAYLKTHYRAKKKRNTPWYMLTSGKCYNYEERQKPFGAHTDYFRVESEQSQFNKKNTIKKFTRAEFITRLIEEKMQAWETKNPKPAQEIKGTKNAFYEPQFAQWTIDHDKELNAVKTAVNAAFGLHSTITLNKEGTKLVYWNTKDFPVQSKKIAEVTINHEFKKPKRSDIYNIFKRSNLVNKEAA